MRRIRTAIIGMGRMGKMRYELLSAHGGYEIVGICDVNHRVLEHYDVPIYHDWKECLKDCEAEAVFVCTVNSVIADIVCTALDAGINVFSEKPPGKDLLDVETMKAAHDRHPDLVLKYGFNHRYHNSVIEAKALINSGLVGEVVCARGVYGKAGSLNFSKEWRNDPMVSGGGILVDQGIHMLDLLRYFVGDFTEVCSSVDRLVWQDLNTEDSAFAILKTDKGQLASIHSNALQWRHKFDLDIICTEGYIALNGLITSSNSYGEERMSWYHKDLNSMSGALGRPLEHTLCFDSDESWEYEHQEFYEAIVCGTPIRQGTIEDAWAVMNVIEQIYRNWM